MKRPSTRTCLGGVITLVALATGSADGHAQPTKLATASVGAQWPGYNNGLDSQRFSPLKEITAQNIDRLNEVCRVKIADGGSFHTGPVVVDGTMYVTTPHDTVALDPTRCSVRWRHSYQPDEPEIWPVNRGVAYLNGRVFRGYADGRLVAVDAKTGELLWKNIVGDPKSGEFLAAAPVAWNGLVFIGLAGSDWGIKGRMMAYDALTGREVWRFNTIPTGTEPGADSWEIPESALTGGGGTWTSYTIDISAAEVFVSVANPAPDFVGRVRPGSNLYTNSLVVLDARTGALKWYYQITPGDVHDVDLGAAAMLYRDSNQRQLVALASKDGYVYAVDRLTHSRVFRTPATTIENEGVPITVEGIKACPGAIGGAEWNGPAYDAVGGSILVGMVDWCSILKKDEQAKFVAGQIYYGGSWTSVGEGRGWVTALNPDTGEVRWQYHADAPVVAGVTPTAGGVTFSGDTLGHFFALDSASGKMLKSWDTGGAVAGGVVTYEQDGRQYVAFTSGNVSRVTFGAVGAPSIVVMALGESGGEPSEAEPTGGAALAEAGPGDPARGQALYAEVCAACHGGRGEGGAGPSLRDLQARRDLPSTIEWIKNPSAKMPKLFPSALDAQDVNDIASFVNGF